MIHSARYKHPRPAKRLRMAAWALTGTVVAGAVTNALTGVITSGVRGVLERVTGGESLVVHSELIASVCGTWVIPGGRPASQPSHPPSHARRSAESMRAWLHSQNAVDLGRTTVELTIRGRSGAAVVLREMRVKIVERHDPVVGAEVNGACGSPVPQRLYGVDLDADRPVASPRNEEGPAVPFPYKVTQGDPEVLLVAAQTEACDCRWVLEIAYIDGDQERVKVIDDRGRPFRTTGVAEKRPSKEGK